MYSVEYTGEQKRSLGFYLTVKVAALKHFPNVWCGGSEIYFDVAFPILDD